MTAPDVPALLALNAHIWATADRPPNEDTTWADIWAEQRKDEAEMPSTDPRADDRAADNYAEKRFR
jgi:hypothetical protein